MEQKKEQSGALITIPTCLEVEGVTGRLVIRKYAEHGDEEHLWRAVVRSHEHLKRWIPWAKDNTTLEDVHALIHSRFLPNFNNQQDEFVFGIWLDGEFAGGTGFHLRHGPLSSQNIEIGMWIREDLAGKGLGKRVLNAMLDWAFTTWTFYRVVWVCDVENIPSCKLAEHCGLVREGTLRKNFVNPAGERRDSHVYAMLKPEWEALRQKP